MSEHDGTAALMVLVEEERRCPRCGCRSLRAVETVQGTRNHFCTACHRCWHPEHSYLLEVNRYVCAGCDDRQRCLRSPAPDPPLLSTLPDTTMDELVHLLGW